MKKFQHSFTVALLLVLMASCSAWGAPQGVYGPRIKGLQLGMSMTISEMVNKASELIGNGEAYLYLSKEGGWAYVWSDVSYGVSSVYEVSVRGGKFQSAEFYSGNFPLPDNFPRVFYPNNLASIDRLGEIGFYSAELEVNPSSFVFRIDGQNRLTAFTLDKRAFDAENMSDETFLRSLKDAYDLPELDGSVDSSSLLHGVNRAEGWEVWIHLKEKASILTGADSADSLIQVYGDGIPIRGGGSFD